MVKIFKKRNEISGKKTSVSVEFQFLKNFANISDSGPKTKSKFLTISTYKYLLKDKVTSFIHTIGDFINISFDKQTVSAKNIKMNLVNNPQKTGIIETGTIIKMVVCECELLHSVFLNSENNVFPNFR